MITQETLIDKFQRFKKLRERIYNKYHLKIDCYNPVLGLDICKLDNIVNTYIRGKGLVPKRKDLEDGISLKEKLELFMEQGDIESIREIF